MRPGLVAGFSPQCQWSQTLSRYGNFSDGVRSRLVFVMAGLVLGGDFWIVQEAVNSEDWDFTVRMGICVAYI